MSRREQEEDEDDQDFAHGEHPVAEPCGEVAARQRTRIGDERVKAVRGREL